jgi:MazG family protein
MRPILTDRADILDPPAAARTTFGGAFERLVGLMALLRAPGGCPWDREQTLQSLKQYLLEETYEVLDAIDEGAVDPHREELGDLLLQVVFQAELRREAGEFDAADVAHGIADKLVRRHSHVFGDARAADAASALANWERQKQTEKQGRSVVAGTPKSLPALLRAQRISEKVSRLGFDWSDASGPLAKIQEELQEVDHAIRCEDKAAAAREVGDLLLACSSLARKLDVVAEDALHAATERFCARIRHMETSLTQSGEQFHQVGAAALDDLWAAAKHAEG